MSSRKSLIVSTSLPVMLYAGAYATLIDVDREDQDMTTKNSSSTLLKLSEKNDVEFWLDVDSINCRTQELEEALTHQSQTTHLALSTLSLEENVLKILDRFPTIQHLFLEENILINKEAKVLDRLTDLKELDLSRNQITSKGQHYIPLDKLKALSINFLNLRDFSFLEKLKNAPRLETLHICGLRTNTQDLEQLAQSSSLKDLDVSYKQVTSGAVAKAKHHHPKRSILFDK